MSNCIIFAFTRFFREGGYLVIRKSRHGWWPHVIWCRDLRNADIEHYVPVVEKLDKPVIKKILFKGRVKTDDCQ